MTFGLAVNRRWQNRQTQEWEEATSFFDVVCWREMAENVSETITRGARVMVAGRLEQRSWETQEGDQRSKVEVVADEIGPSLRWATAQITKNERRGPGEYSRGGGGGGGGGGRPAAAPPAQPQPAADAGGLRIRRGALLMARNNQRGGTTSRRAPKDLGRRVKKKPCALCRDKIEWVDYKDVPMLRKYMSDRGKIRSRRVTGNCAQHQRALAMAIKTARELVLLPYTQRTVTERPGGRGGGRDRGERTLGDSVPTEAAAAPPLARRAAAPRPWRIAEAVADRRGGRGGRRGRGCGRGRRGARGDGSGRMKVVLRDDVAGVGRRGDIVKVAGGFARNFLLPEGRAIVATEGVEGQAEQMRRGRDLREAQDRGAAEAQATVLAGAVIPITRPGGRRRPALRLHRPGRRGGGHQGRQGRRGGPQARRAARAHQGDGLLRGDRRAVPRRRHRGDGGGLGRLLTRGRTVRAAVTARAIHGAVTDPRAHHGGVPTVRYTGCPQCADHSCTAYPHARVPYPHLLGPYVPQTPTGRVGEPWSKPLTTPAPARCGRPPPRAERHAGAAARPRGRGVAARGHAPLQRRGVGRDREVLGGRLLQAGARAHLRRHPGAHGAGRGHRRGDGDRRAEALGRARGGRRPAPSSSRCRPTRRRSPTRGTTPSIVEEHALLRKLIGVAGDIADIGYSVPEDVKAAVDEAEQMVFNVGERRTVDTMRPLHELLGAGLDRIEELGQRGSDITGVATGYHELDKILLGLPALVAEHRGRPPRHGEDELRPRGPGQRRAAGRSGRPSSSPSRWATWS